MAEANSCTKLAPLRRPVQRARCRAHFSGARSGIGTGILGPRIFSHVRCLWELESSCSIFVLSLASCLRSSGWTILCSSLDHFCIIFSRSSLLLPGVFLTLRVSSSTNSTLCLSLESRLSFEEPPRFLFHLLETLFIFSGELSSGLDFVAAPHAPSKLHLSPLL